MSTGQQPAVIEIRVRRLDQLFESLDPSPFHERDLDPNAADYIVNWARDLPRDRPLLLRIYMAEAGPSLAEGAGSAIRTFFTYQAGNRRRDLRDLFAMGWVYLAIGVTVLAGAIVGGQLAMALLEPPVSEVLREGLIILGWVANWKPLQTFLYDWLPVRRDLRLLRQLAEATVELVEPPAKSG